MLNKINFEIAKLASKQEDASEAVRGLLVSQDRTVATDGHMVIEITGFEHAGDILPFDDVLPQQDFAPFIMPAEEALALSKVFIKSDSPDANLIGIDPQQGNHTSFFGLRQPKSEKVFKIDRPVAQYPDYEKVIPNVTDELYSVTLNANLLMALLQQMIKLNFAIRFGFYGPEKAVRLDCIEEFTKQSARAALMPMKT